MFIYSKFWSIRHPQLCSFRNYVPEYNKRKLNWFSRKLSGISARYPKLLRNVFVGSLLALFFYKIADARYKDSQLRKKLTKDEYEMYKLKKKAVIANRLSYGKDLYIPFFTKDVATEQDERTDEIYFKS